MGRVRNRMEEERRRREEEERAFRAALEKISPRGHVDSEGRMKAGEVPSATEGASLQAAGSAAGQSKEKREKEAMTASFFARSDEERRREEEKGRRLWQLIEQLRKDSQARAGAFGLTEEQASKVHSAYKQGWQQMYQRQQERMQQPNAYDVSSDAYYKRSDEENRARLWRIIENAKAASNPFGLTDEQASKVHSAYKQGVKDYNLQSERYQQLIGEANRQLLERVNAYAPEAQDFFGLTEEQAQRAGTNAKSAATEIGQKLDANMHDPRAYDLSFIRLEEDRKRRKQEKAEKSQQANEEMIAFHEMDMQELRAREDYNAAIEKGRQMNGLRFGYMEQSNVFFNGKSTDYERGIAYLTPEELEKLDYLYGTDEAKAKEYQNHLLFVGAQRGEIERAKTIGDYGTGRVLFESPIRGIESGLAGQLKTLERLFGNNAQMVKSAEMLAYERELQQESGLVQGAGQLLYTVGNMAPAVGASMFNPLAGNAAMFATVYGNDYSEAKKEGKSDYEAHSFALLDAGMEIALNIIGGRIAGGVAKLAGKKSLAKDTIKQLVKSPALQRTLNLLTDMHAEGTEEYIQAVLQPWIRNVAYGEHNKIDWTPEGGLQAYLMGALTAGVFNGMSYGLGLSADKKTCRLDMTYDNGRKVPIDTAMRVAEGRATDEDTRIMQRYGAEVIETGIEAKLKEVKTMLNAQMGNKKYGQILRETKNMNVFEKALYYGELISDPAFRRDIGRYNEAIAAAKAKAMEAAKGDVIRKTAEHYGKRSGYQVRFEAMAEGINGYVDTKNKILHLSEDVNKASLYTMAHEMVHNVEDRAEYQLLSKVVEENLIAQNKTIEGEIQSIQEQYAAKGIELDEQGAHQEMVARFIAQNVFGKGKETALMKLIYESPSTAKTIWRGIQNKINAIGANKADRALLEAKNIFEKALSRDADTLSLSEPTAAVQYDINSDVENQEPNHEMSESDVRMLEDGDRNGTTQDENVLQGEKTGSIIEENKTNAPNGGNYRRLFIKEFPNFPLQDQVHHTLPRKYEKTMKDYGINIHENRYLRGVESLNHNEVTNAWKNWDKSLGHAATAEEVIEFAKRIDEQFGKYWHKE